MCCILVYWCIEKRAWGAPVQDDRVTEQDKNPFHGRIGKASNLKTFSRHLVHRLHKNDLNYFTEQDISSIIDIVEFMLDFNSNQCLPFPDIVETLFYDSSRVRIFCCALLLNMGDVPLVSFLILVLYARDACISKLKTKLYYYI